MSDLICMRLNDMFRRHPLQDDTRKCSRCKTQVGIYPSGQAALNRDPELAIICQVCAADRHYDVGMLAPGAEIEPFESYTHGVTIEHEPKTKE